MTLRYVYSIAPSFSAPDIDRAALAGIDDSRVRAIAESDLAAVTSDLPEDEWRDDVLNERIRDLEWLTPRAAAHQEVNARALELAGALIPLSFGALYRGDDRVREMLRDDRDAKVRKLDELRGKAEWVVTLTRDAGDVPLMTADLVALDREIAASDPGRAYLLEKRRTNVATLAAERADDDAARRACHGERAHLPRAGPARRPRRRRAPRVAPRAAERSIGPAGDRAHHHRARRSGLPRSLIRALARVPLRIVAVSDVTTTTEVALVDLVDRLLSRGVVLAGGATISVAGVDLIELRLNVVLAAVDAFDRSLQRSQR